MFDPFDFAEFESLFPGSLTGDLEVVCQNCGKGFVVQGEEGEGVLPICTDCLNDNQ